MKTFTFSIIKYHKHWVYMKGLRINAVASMAKWKRTIFKQQACWFDEVQLSVMSKNAYPNGYVSIDHLLESV